MSELIDREAFAKRIKRGQHKLEDTYGLNDEYVKCLDEVLDKLSDAKAIEAASPWHRVEEPPQSGKEYFTAYRSILRSDPEWLYDICYYTDDLARDCPLMDGAEHRPGWHRYESEYGDVECHPKYWMPIEPPKEDE